MSKLNDMLTGRLYLGNAAINQFGINLFGTEIEWILSDDSNKLTDYLYVDSSYVNALLTYGPAVLALIIASFSVLIYRKHATGQYQFTIVLLLLAVHSFSDPQLMELRFDPFLMLLSGSILKLTNAEKLKRVLCKHFPSFISD